MDPQDPTLANVLMGYGHGYSDPRLEMDSADYSTRNVLSGMEDKNREGYGALARLFMTGMVPMAAAHRASGNLPLAVSRHFAQERKEGNPLLSPWFVYPSALSNGYTVANGISELMAGAPGISTVGMGGTALGAAAMAPHIRPTMRMLQHLNRTEPKTTTLY